MSTKIIFLVDSTTLPPGGATPDTALPISHPPMTLVQSGCATQTDIDGDTLVKIGGDEPVRILVVEAHNILSVRMAPHGLMVHDFNGSTKLDMTDSDTRPISVPSFSVNYDNVPYLDYTSPNNPQWGTVPNSFENWAGSPIISQDLTASIKQIYAPFIEFFGSEVVSGKMHYGLVFVVTRDGRTQEYFYFDPYLNINDPSRVGQSFSKRARAR